MQSCGTDDSRPSAVDIIVHLQDECNSEGERHRRTRDLESSALLYEPTIAIRDEGLRRPVVQCKYLKNKL